MTENDLALVRALVLYAMVVPESLVVKIEVESTMVVLEDPSSGQPLYSPIFLPPTPPLFLLFVLLLWTHCPKSTTKRYQWGCPSSGG